MSVSYNLFMCSFVLFFFVLARLMWAPETKCLTPIIIGCVAFLLNSIIAIGDLMMRLFDLQWAGLPLNKLCVLNEHAVMNVSQQYCISNSLELRDTTR